MDTKEIFAERLFEIRENRGITRQKAADDLGISRASLEYYEKAKRTPDLNTISKISDYFNVSIDYLMGKSDCVSYDLDLQGVCKYFNIDKTTALGLSSLLKSNEKYSDELKVILGSHALKTVISYILVSWDLRRELGYECLSELEKVTGCMNKSAEELFDDYGEDGYYSHFNAECKRLQNEIELNEYRAEKYFAKDLLNCNSRSYDIYNDDYEMYLNEAIPTEKIIDDMRNDIDMAIDDINDKIKDYVEEQYQMDED